MTYNNAINCLKASIVSFFLLFFQPSFSQLDTASLTRLLQTDKAAFGNDFVVLVGTKDTLLYSKEVGAIKGKTAAPIASSSKWLTAALIMQFVDDGKISLDDPIVKYLPIYEKYGKNYITIRHCLAHLTGIQNRTSKFRKLIDRKKPSTLEEEVESFAASEIETNPGTTFNYNGLGMNIAGRILEIVSKKRFDLLIRQKLLNPLGMRQTTFTTLDGSAPDPSDGARSTALDYMAFLKMLLNNGKHNGKSVLSEASVAELRKIHTANVPMKDVPKEAAGFQHALGAWAVESNGSTATVLAGPSLAGTWPVVDYCRGIALLVFPKTLQNDQKSNGYGDLKKLADRNFPSNCH